MAKYHQDSLFETENPQPICRGIIQVAFDSGVDRCFSYGVADKLWPVRVGVRVEAPFGRANKSKTGFCVSIEDNPNARAGRFKLKQIERIIDDEPLIDEQLMTLARWISDYYACPLGQVLSASVPAAVKKAVGQRQEKLIYLAADNPEIRDIISKLRGKKQRQIIEFLKQEKAYSPQSAVSQQIVLAESNSTAATLKRLAQQQVINITKNTVLKSLPAIPENLTGFAVEPKQITLNSDQKKTLDSISSELDKGRFGVSLLYGVTDSGKTEVYIRAIQKTIELP